MRSSDSAAPGGTSISRPGSRPSGSRPPGTKPPGGGPRGPAGERHLALVRPADAPVAPVAPDAATGTADPADPAGPGAPARRPTARGKAATALARINAAAQQADRRLLTALRHRGEDRRVAGVVRVLGLTGEHAAVWLATGAAGALGDPQRRTQWLRATALVAGAHAVSIGAKRAVRRPRPRIAGAAPLVRTASAHSFPSSHAASSTAAAVAFGALLPGTATVPALAAAISASRLVAGVHYPSDVLCGALLGAAAARLGRAWELGGGRHG